MVADIESLETIQEQFKKASYWLREILGTFTNVLSFKLGHEGKNIIEHF
jgi:hypothetical protein